MAWAIRMGLAITRFSSRVSGKTASPANSTNGNKGIASTDGRRDAGQLVVAEQRVGGNIKNGGYGKQQRHRAIGIEQVAAGPGMQQQAGESRTGHQPHQGQGQPQREGEHDQINHAPERCQYREQECEQAHPVDDHGRAAPRQQRQLPVWQNQPDQFGLFQFPRNQAGQTVPDEVCIALHSHLTGLALVRRRLACHILDMRL